ncbi:hypothetical protein [Ciceribacter sp. L1K22]|uniref:hypothetical protein n=1 Tax=Ciceribacter sp. L1K22 TaxID=2820275 RepID=UPI001ABDF619|nr:hypothetical protein [Ciceribacter sp. L1K22]MBO3760581.1 hypothetical protein [Ciceribacter sp. L1K22]
MRKVLCSAAIALQLAAGVASISHYQAEAAVQHRMKRVRSPYFIMTALEKRGIEVIAMRRLAQVYFLHVRDGFGTEALMAVDGRNSEIIGLLVLSLGRGVSPIVTGSRGRHFVDLTYTFGYTVEWTVFESYTVITTEELSVTEEYVEVTYEEYEEVVYEEVEEYAEGDLDEGLPDDAAGDLLVEEEIEEYSEEATFSEDHQTEETTDDGDISPQSDQSADEDTAADIEQDMSDDVGNDVDGADDQAGDDEAIYEESDDTTEQDDVVEEEVVDKEPDYADDAEEVEEPVEDEFVEDEPVDDEPVIDEEE